MRANSERRNVLAAAARIAGALIASYCSAIVAQQSAPQATERELAQTLERVIITGSRLPQIEGETALPVQIITREEIERSGITTPAQLLELVPANVNSFNDAMAVDSGARPGLSAVNLRGLGGGATLVLINGRRLANYAFDGARVDVNSIPLAAIDRVEILKDGASAIYGSDAIAGVINFILRKDYTGAEVSGYGSITQHGGGETWLASSTIGFGSLAADRYNAFVTATFQKNEALRAAERDISRTGYRPEIGLIGLSFLTFPANIVDLPRRRLVNPTYAEGCAPPISLPRPPRECGFDSPSTIDLLPEVERGSILGRASWRLNPNTDLFAEALHSRNRFEKRIAPPSIMPMTPFGQLLYPVSGPFYPTAFAGANGLSGNLLLAYRAVELGRRINIITSDAQRFVVGAEGDLAQWNYSASVIYSRNTQEDEYLNGWVYASRLVPAMRTGLINPFGPSGPEGQALLASTAYSGTPHTAKGTTSAFNVFASRNIAQLPAGPLALAIGGDVRREKLSNDWDPSLLSGDPLLFSTPRSVEGSRSVYALFAELGVPIMRGLEAQLALRYDHNSDFGSTTNPKIALRWQPIRPLLLRGAWGTGFRAPPLYDLYQVPYSAGVIGFRDPVRCPVTGAIDDCEVVAPSTTGGNRELRPEESTQWYAGLVFEPTRGLTLGLDYWNIKIENVIEALRLDVALQSYDQFSFRFIRGPVDPAFPNLPGPILNFDGTRINIDSRKTSGIDASIVWNTPKFDWGTLRLSVLGTYVMQWTATVGGVDMVSLGSDAFVNAIPRWRTWSTLNWNRGFWGATLSHAYVASYTDQFPGANGAPRDVGSFMTWDVQGTYSGFRRWRLAAGIRNLLDEDPPASNRFTSSYQVGFNPQLHSPLGRLFYLRATYAFK